AATRISAPPQFFLDYYDPAVTNWPCYNHSAGISLRAVPVVLLGRQMMEFKTVALGIPEGCNIIVGQSHFIKTAEDLYELLITGCPHAKFGVAFCEASGPCLVRVEGNDPELQEQAAGNAMKI